MVCDGACQAPPIMKAVRLRFVRVAWIGFTTTVLVAGFAACEDDATSRTTTNQDAAAPFEPPDSATADSAPSSDAAPDAVAPPDVSVDAGTDADAAPAVQADVTADFSTTNGNPNGAWTYGYTLSPQASQGAPFVVYPAVSNGDPEIPSWYDPANVSLGAPAAWRNDSAAINTGVQPGEFAMHPGSNGEYAVARWTAPAAGSYAVSLQFKAGDTGETENLLVHNGTVLVTDDSTEAVHDLVVTLAAGDRLDAVVGSKGDFHFDTTPVHLTIRASAGAP